MEEAQNYLASFFNKDETTMVNRLLKYNRVINSLKDLADKRQKSNDVIEPKEIFEEVEVIDEF